MKKIIRLTESDLIKLVKKVINESKFKNQSVVDDILDKISSKGVESLTDRERRILNNPDADIESDDQIDVVEVLEKIKDFLIDEDIVNPDDIRVVHEDKDHIIQMTGYWDEDDDVDFIEISNFKQYDFDFFKDTDDNGCEGLINLSVRFDENSNNYNLIFTALGQSEDICKDIRIDVYEYIKNDLSNLFMKINMNVIIKDYYDDDITDVYN